MLSTNTFQFIYSASDVTNKTKKIDNRSIAWLPSFIMKLNSLCNLQQHRFQIEFPTAHGHALKNKVRHAKASMQATGTTTN